MPIVRTSRLSVRASPAELNRWNSVARHLGHATTAHWIRALLTTSELAGDNGQQVSAELYSLRHALSRIGNNLNQLAHSAHCGDHIHCGETLTELEDRLHQIDGLLAQSRSRPPPAQVRPVCQDASLKTIRVMSHDYSGEPDQDKKRCRCHCPTCSPWPKK